MSGRGCSRGDPDRTEPGIEASSRGSSTVRKAADIVGVGGYVTSPDEVFSFMAKVCIRTSPVLEIAGLHLHVLPW